MHETTAELTTRLAGRGDQLAICTLLQQAWHSAGGARWDQLDALGEGCTALLALRGSHTVAFCLFDLRTAPAASLAAIAVADREPLDVAWRALWPAAKRCLPEHNVQSVHYVGEAPWLLEILAGHGFRQATTLLSYEKILDGTPLPARQGNLSVHPVRPADLDTVAQIDAACFPMLWRYPRPMLEAALQSAAHLTAAELERRLVGYQLCMQEGSEGQIVRLAVLPECQRQGVGSRLLAESLATFRHGRVRRLSLNTQSDNQAAQALYERFGFRRTGEGLPVLEKSLPTAR